MGLAVAFWILSVVTILAALGVLFQSNVFRAALSLIVCLSAVAGIFVTLNADFLAGAQILIYVGAISVLIILAIMLTRDLSHGNPTNSLRAPALLITAVFFGLAAFAVIKTNWNVAANLPDTPTTVSLGDKLFGQGGFILPLEIAPVLILAVILGAIITARER
jgi:NADH-quinone oxidoreductase subunit J